MRLKGVTPRGPGAWGGAAAALAAVFAAEEAAANEATYVAADDETCDEDSGKEVDWHGRDALQDAAAYLEENADNRDAEATILVCSGAYRGFELFRTSHVTFRAKASADVIIDETHPRGEGSGINLEGPLEEVVVEGFRVQGMPRHGIRAVECDGVELLDNLAKDNTQNNILTGFCDDLLIEGNEAIGAEHGHGIYVADSSADPVVRDNFVRGNKRNGIQLNGDRHAGGTGLIEDAVVESNWIFENGEGGGSAINADGMQDSIIQNNLIYDNEAAGISLFRIDGAESSVRNLVVNNTVAMPFGARPALQIHDGSNDNTIANNVLVHEDEEGGAIAFDRNAFSGTYSDYNVVYGTLSTHDGRTTLSLEAWQSETGEDQNSHEAEAEEVFTGGEDVWADAPDPEDFRPAPEGPACGNGTDYLPDGRTGFDAPEIPDEDRVGTSRKDRDIDIGAYQRLEDDCRNDEDEDEEDDEDEDDEDDDEDGPPRGPPGHAQARGR